MKYYPHIVCSRKFHMYNPYPFVLLEDSPFPSNVPSVAPLLKLSLKDNNFTPLSPKGGMSHICIDHINIIKYYIPKINRNQQNKRGKILENTLAHHISLSFTTNSRCRNHTFDAMGNQTTKDKLKNKKRLNKYKI